MVRTFPLVAAIMLAGCASSTVRLGRTAPLESVIIARFSFEYGGVVSYEADEDEEGSGQIRGIIPGIVRAVNWVSEMNQISLIQAEMSDASRSEWKARLDSMYDSFREGLIRELYLPVVEPEDIGESVARNDWGQPNELEDLEYARRAGCSAVLVADAGLSFDRVDAVPVIGFLFKPRYHPVVEISVAMYDSEGNLLWRDTARARGRTASAIDAGWFFSEEPFDASWPRTPTQLFMDAAEQLFTQTLENRPPPASP